MSELFKEIIVAGNTFKGDSITIGGAFLNGQAIPDAHVKVPLKTLNRHGLIAGATGTGKTKTLQVIAEQMSLKGIPTLLMDIKGDLSGLAAIGVENDFIKNRHSQINLPYAPEAMPVELMTINKGDGVYLKSTISEFGPVLLGRILELNDTQSSILSMVFVYCDRNELPLIDIKDLRKVLQFFINEGKAEVEAEFGQVSAASINTILRKLLELEQQGAEKFFGELSFDPQDLCRLDERGRGYINILRLMDVQNTPKLFSTFMLSLLVEIYQTFPEVGDLEKPKLCIFIDEAHLVFSEASKTLLDQIEVIIKLIRSKGVGIFFCTQNPIDVPDAILSQLGLKVQHALRAFTAKDRVSIKKAAQNYPESEFYKVDEMLTALGTGEAFVTALNEKGIPTPLAAIYTRSPLSRMDILTDEEVVSVCAKSALIPKYNHNIDRESAYEILKKKLEGAQSEEVKEKSKAQSAKEEKELEKMVEREKREAIREHERQRKEAERLKKEEEKKAKERKKMWTNVADSVSKGATSSRGGGVIGSITRTILGVLFKK